MNMPALVLYDGHCGLCSGVVQTLLKLDKDEILRFAPLQSAFAKTQLEGTSLDTLGLDSVVLVEGQQAYVKSDAFLRIMKHLGWPYRLVMLGKILPKGARDWLYDLVARHRYQFFGQHDDCWLPKPEWRDRLLGEER